MARGHIELVHLPEISVGEWEESGWPVGVRAQMLSRDDQSGAMSTVLEVPAGWRRPAGCLGAACEWLLLEGSLRIGEHMRGFGWYEFVPEGGRLEPWSTDTGCRVLFFSVDGAPSFVSGGGEEIDGRIAVDSDAVPWEQSHIPGPAEGLLHKLLRLDEASGEMTCLTGTARAYDYPMLEFHDCVEEIFMVEGDIWLGNSGRMTAGSYFWRPAFITHGPFYSQEGALMLVRVPTTLVNHVPLSAASSPEENMGRFIAAGGRRVMVETAGPTEV